MRGWIKTTCLWSGGESIAWITGVKSFLQQDLLVPHKHAHIFLETEKDDAGWEEEGRKGKQATWYKDSIGKGQTHNLSILSDRRTQLLELFFDNRSPPPFTLQKTILPPASLFPPFSVHVLF